MVKVKALTQSTTTGILLTFAIALITFGTNFLQENVEQWYIGAAAVLLGLVMIIIDVYVLKSQANC